MFKNRSAAVFLCAVLGGCGQIPGVSEDEANYTRVDVYYRSFDAPAPIPYSRDDLIRSATIAFSTKDDVIIDELIDAVPDGCLEVREPSESSLDYFLLILFFDRDELRKEISSSELHYLARVGSLQKVCKLSEEDRQLLARTITKSASLVSKDEK